MKEVRRVLSGILWSFIVCFLAPCIVFAEGETDFLNTIDSTLDLSNKTEDVHEAGYTWESDGADGYILTLKNVYITGNQTNQNNITFALKLPEGIRVTIKTDGVSYLNGAIVSIDKPQKALNLVFDGAELTIDGGIFSSVKGDAVTVQGGSDITVGTINLGESFLDSSISVIGTDSILTIKDNTYVSCLKVINGGELIADNTIFIVSLYNPDDTWTLGDVTMDSSSKIEINAIPTLVSLECNDQKNDVLCDVLGKIKDYLPAEYHIGLGTMTNNDGNTSSYYTILDSSGNIADSLTLEEQIPDDPDNSDDNKDPGNSDDDNNPPQETDPPEEDDPTEENPSPEVPKPAKPTNKPGSGGSGKPGSSANSNSQSQNTGINVGSSSANPADSSQAAGSDTSPRTGDHDAAGMWFFYALGSAAVLCLLACRYKTRKNR